MHPLHQQINEDNVHEVEGAAVRLQSRWISSSRVITDKPPSQPLSPRRLMSRRPRSGSVEESQHKDPGTVDSQGGSLHGRLQRSNSKWASGSGVIIDSPPLQPLSHRGASIESLALGGSRWNSGSQADFHTASPQALSCHRTQPNRYLDLEHSVPMKKHDSFGSTFSSFNLSQGHLSQASSGAESALRCTTSRSA
jgi:hypothetical protein